MKVILLKRLKLLDSRKQPTLERSKLNQNSSPASMVSSKKRTCAGPWTPSFRWILARGSLKRCWIRSMRFWTVDSSFILIVYRAGLPSEPVIWQITFNMLCYRSANALIRMLLQAHAHATLSHAHSRKDAQTNGDSYGRWWNLETPKRESLVVRRVPELTIFWMEAPLKFVLFTLLMAINSFKTKNITTWCSLSAHAKHSPNEWRRKETALLSLIARFYHSNDVHTHRWDLLQNRMGSTGEYFDRRPHVYIFGNSLYTCSILLLCAIDGYSAKMITTVDFCLPAFHMNNRESLEPSD